MLKFYSGNVRSANTEKALKECFGKAFKECTPTDLLAVIIYAAIGHNLEKINEIIEKEYPGTSVVGASCGGVVGTEGPGESMHEVGMLAICGSEDEIDVRSVDGVTEVNSFEKMTELSKSLDVKKSDTAAVWITIPGFDCAMDDVVRGFNEVFSDSSHLTGGISSDNMKRVTSYQLHDGNLSEHMIWAVAIADPSISCLSRATHGFDVIGDPMEITETDGTKFISIDGKPAPETYYSLFKYAEVELTSDTIPFGVIAEKIPEEYWEEYGSEYRLNGMMKFGDKSLQYRTHMPAGTKVKLAVRNEKSIFSEMERVIKEIKEEIDGKILAVSHSDCISRGRNSLNVVKKEELIGIMQEGLNDGMGIPPWLGMYGFGEFCQLGGKNSHHTYTTSLTVMYRKE